MESYRDIAKGSSTLNTETREGDQTVMRSLRISSRRVAKEVLAFEPYNPHARAILRWTNSGSNKMPRLEDLVSIFKSAGFETYSADIR